MLVYANKHIIEYLPNFSPQVIITIFRKVEIKLCIDKIIVDYHVIQTNNGAEALFRSPGTFKEELLAPRKMLIKAGWCNILLCLLGSA